jgi:putative membrane protein
VRPAHLALLVGTIAVMLISSWRPYERFTWWLEIFPGLVGMVVLAATYRQFRFTTLCYVLIALHITILCVGGHYTYARVPLFDWLRPLFGWERNHYDRLGHFAQGFVPAMVARELFVRLRVFNRPRWLPVIVVSVCVAISACYELIEWCVALLSGTAAESFLGTQGDVWDTQEDMFAALIGATCAIIFLARLQDRAIRQLTGATPQT